MDTQETLQHLKRWAEENEHIRALILTSSRVTSNAKLDSFSDYDVAVYVDDIKNFDDNWLDYFGEVLVKWPLTPQTTFSKDWVTRLVLYESRLRIDFQVTEKKTPPSDYDGGYQVLIDKDDLTKNFPKATQTEYLIKKPTEEEFSTLVNDFFWDGTYVPKHLWRGNLLFAKFMFNAVVFGCFEKMTEWYIASKNNWNVTTELHGKDFKKFLDKETWDKIRQIFVGPDIEENWQAFFLMFDLFTHFAQQVATNLGFTYPKEQEEKMSIYMKESKEIKK